jgi:RNA polymerase sigma-70 factor (ECF subfamily)
MMLRNRAEIAHSEPTDDDLLSMARRGDERAFAKLYDRYRDSVFRFAYRLVSSVATAEDITQDCFLSLFRNSTRFRGTHASLRTYLLAAARNLALKSFHKTAAETDFDEVTGEPVSGEVGPLARVLDTELGTVVRTAVESLPALQREALVMFEYEEMSLAEIAEVVGADVGTVKARLYRARQRLRHMLSPYLNEHSSEHDADEVLK